MKGTGYNVDPPRQLHAAIKITYSRKTTQQRIPLLLSILTKWLELFTTQSQLLTTL